MGIVNRAIFFVALFVVSLSAMAQSALAADPVQPIHVQNNPTCADLSQQFGFGYLFEYKIDPVADQEATLSFEGLNGSVRMDETDQQTFDYVFTGDFAAAAVFAKAGNEGNLYLYASTPEVEGATEDSGLHGPLNPRSNKLFDLSHITFCLIESHGGSESEITQPVGETPSEPEGTQSAEESPSELEATQPAEENASEPEVTQPTDENVSDPEVTQPDEQPATEPETTQPAEESASEPGVSQPAEETASGPGETQPTEETASDPEGTSPAEETASEPDGTQPTEEDQPQPEATQPTEETESGPEETQPTDGTVDEPTTPNMPENADAPGNADKLVHGEESEIVYNGEMPVTPETSQAETPAEQGTQQPAEDTSNEDTSNGEPSNQPGTESGTAQTKSGILYLPVIRR